MRQVFSSARLENVEQVAQLLREAGIEVRITQGRSYRGNRRGTFSYREQDGPQPAVWVVKSEDQTRARQMLREAGLIDSTRGDAGAMSFRFEPDTQKAAAAPGRKRALRIKLALIAGIVIVVAMAIVDTVRTPPAPALAAPPYDGTPQATLPGIAQAVFAHEMQEAQLPVLCLSIDGRDASAALINEVARAPFTTVPASHCRRVADSNTGSVFPRTGQPALLIGVQAFRPSAADAGTVQVEAYHHRMYGSYKTLEVRLVDGAWRVTDTLKHVSIQG